MLAPREQPKLRGAARRRVWLVALSAGPLWALSQPPVDIPLLGLVALAPLFLALPRLSAGGAWLATFAVAYFYYFCSTWWLGQMATAPGSEPMIFGMFLFSCFVMAFKYAFAGMAVRWLLTRSARWVAWLVPALWLGMEFLHELDTPAPYPWLPASSTVAELHLFIQTADLWGAYGVSLLVALVWLAPVTFFELRGQKAELRRVREGRLRHALPATAALLVLGSLAYGWVRTEQIAARETGDGPLIGCVQANLSQEVKISEDPDRLPRSFREHLDLSRKSVSEGAEMVVWAETMVFYGSTREGLSHWDEEGSRELYDEAGRPLEELLEGVTVQGAYIGRLRAEVRYNMRTPVLAGVLSTIPEDEQTDGWKSYFLRRYNTALFIDDEGRVTQSYDKRYLVPGGEYIPHEGNPAVRALVEAYAGELQGGASYVEPGRRLTVFSLPSKAARLHGRPWQFTSSICYEFAFPSCFVELHDQPEARYPDFHVNLSNEGWFKDSSELDQAVDYCRFRCIESRIPMVRCTNTGISCTLDATGRVRDILTVEGKDREIAGELTAAPAVLADPSPTVYVAWVGRKPAWAALLTLPAIFALMAAGRLRERRARKLAKQNAGKPTGQGAA